MEYTTRRLFVLISFIFAIIFAFLLIGLYGAYNIVYADPEVSYLEYNTTTKVFDAQASFADKPQSNANGDVTITEGEIDEDLVRFWEEYGCIGLVVVFVDAFMLFDWLFVIAYLLQNKKHPDDKSILASKIARVFGLILSIAALIFAIVVIAMHNCTFSILGIVGASIITALFGLSYIIRFDKK